MIFVDSNVPVYVAGRDHPLRDPARRFLDRARSAEAEICTSTEVLQGILFRYSALGRLDIAVEVYDLFVRLCPVVLPVTLADTDRARALLAASDGVSVRDAIHAAVLLNNGIGTIATFDEASTGSPGSPGSACSDRPGTRPSSSAGRGEATADRDPG